MYKYFFAFCIIFKYAIFISYLSLKLGPLDTICIPTLLLLEFSSLASNISSNETSSFVAYLQSAKNLKFKSLTALPVNFICVSLQYPNLLSFPRYSSPTLNPPTKPTLLSITTIFLWFLKFIFILINFNQEGKNSPTFPPSLINLFNTFLFNDLLPTESYNNLTSTPSLAFSSKTFNILVPISSFLNI